MPVNGHSRVALLVADLLHGNLAEPEKGEAQAHVDGCADCRDLAAGYALMSDTLRHLESAIAAEHPGGDEIVSYALRTGTLASDDLLRVSAHVRECAACSEDVEATRHAVDVADRKPAIDASSQWRSQHRLATVLACLVVVLLGYPAYLGLRTTPRLHEEIQALRIEQGSLREHIAELDRSLGEARRELDKTTGWSGAVDYVLLLGRERGTAPVARLRIRSGQPFAAIAIQPSTPPGEASRACRVEIAAEGGSIAWSWQTTGGDLRRRMQASETVLLQVPASSLSAGFYTLRVVPEESGTATPLLEERFLVVLE